MEITFGEIVMIGSRRQFKAEMGGFSAEDGEGWISLTSGRDTLK